MESNYFEANRQLWDQKTDAHVISEFYAVDAFKQGASSLNAIELDLLGDVRENPSFTCSAISGRIRCRWPGLAPA